MKRIINNRPICFFAAALAVGLTVCAVSLGSVAGRVVALAFALIAAGVLFLIKKSKYVYIPMAFAVGIFLLSGVYGAYQTTVIEKTPENMTATISSEIVQSDYGYYYFEVENITADGQKLKKDATVYVWFLPDNRAGDEIKIEGSMKSREFDLDGGFVSKFREGNYYTISARKIEGLGEGELKLATKINVALKRALHDTVDGETADIAVALLLGDKQGIDGAMYDNVKNAGLAHIFAVSGLHVGILAAAFYFLAKKLKIKGYFRLVFVLFFLLLYGGLCGYPSSVVRAIIMSAVFMLADCTGKQKDNLNSLAFAAILVMIFMPIDTFSVGCKMSFTAVLGLILFEKPLEEKVFKKLPKRVSQIVSASIAANVMLFPIMAETFGSVQTLFIIANLIILPILPIIYIFSLIICLFVLIIPQTAPILLSLTMVLWPIKFVSALIGSLAISSISVVSLSVFTAAYFVIALLMSRFVFLTRRVKYTVSLNLIILSLALVPIISLL